MPASALHDRNEALLDVLRELDWSQRGFARRLGDRCTELGNGHTVSYGTVARWCKGSAPGAALAGVACDVLSAALRRDVRPSALGWQVDTTDLVTDSLAYRDVPHTVEMLTRLWELDMQRRRDFVKAGLVASVFAAAAREALVMPADAAVARKGSVAVGAADIELISEQTRHFERLDARWGGGKFRPDFAQFLNSHATPLLVNGSFSDTTGRALYGAVADASILLAFMAYDSGAAGLAQRYDTQAMRLSQAVGDRARITRVLIHQARLAAGDGARRDALTHARSAAFAAADAPPAVQAYAAITEARAWAYNGDLAQTRRAIGVARTAFDRDGETPAWLGWFDRAELEGQAAWALVNAGDADEAERALDMARGKGAELRRDNVGLVITAAEIARLRRDREAAQALTSQAAALAATVTSTRTASRINKLRAAVPLDEF